MNEGFYPLDIDPRGFVYQPPPPDFYGTAYDLWGSARDQWRAWYREQRLKRRGVLEPLARGAIGRVEGIRFVESPEQIFAFDLARDLPPPRIAQRVRRERPAHERIAAQRVRQPKPWRKTCR